MLQFYRHFKGHRLQQAKEWDRVRHIMFAVLKAGGAKHTNALEDVFEIPLIDVDNSQIRPSLLRRMQEVKEQNAAKLISDNRSSNGRD